jgi:diguanylate cyclase (GGDEF)-like protein
LANKLQEGGKYNIYQCKNGLVDIAVPVHLAGEHVANFFTGQFLLSPPDVDLFKQRAQLYGFDETAYLKALDKVPVYSEARVEKIMRFLVSLTEMIGEIGLQNLRQIDQQKKQLQVLEDQVLLRTLELQEATRKAKELANKDPLTGVFNRRAFFELADRELSRAGRYQRPLSIAILDLDQFKQVNDSFGHKTGDDVLVDLARAIEGSLRKEDIFARIGGEEFAIMAPDTGFEAGYELFERMRKTIARRRVGEHGIQYTASFGYTSLNPSDESVSSALARADEAMYRAKKSGRNRVLGLPVDHVNANIELKRVS